MPKKKTSIHSSKSKKNVKAGLLKINENVPLNLLFGLFFFLLTFSLLKTLGFKMSQNSQKKVLGAQTEMQKLQELIYKTEGVLKEKPDYCDGWLYLAFLYYQEGNISPAKDAIKRALIIDPNNQKTHKLWELIILN